MNKHPRTHILKTLTRYLERLPVRPQRNPMNSSPCAAGAAANGEETVVMQVMQEAPAPVAGAPCDAGVFLAGSVVRLILEKT